MPSDNYQKYIETLRNREAEPPFEEIRELVLRQKRSRKFLPIPFWLFASASAPLLVALSILLFPEMFGLQRVAGNRRSIADGQSSATSHQSSLLMTKNHQRTSGERQIKRYERIVLAATTTVEQQQTKDAGAMTNDSKSIAEKTQQNEVIPLVKTIEPKNTELPASPVHSVSESSDNSISNNRLYAFISAGLPAVNSSVPYAGLLFGSAGLRWQVTPASSLIFELRKNTFIQKYTANKLSFHDTTLTVGGQTFHNTIGSLYPVPVEAANDVFSLGAGYRLAFIESGIFIPFAEVIFSASTQGGLTSEMAGIGYSFNSPFSVELALRSDQLYSRSSSPQGVFNLNASVSFAW
jgi:hypothetical protein